MNEKDLKNYNEIREENVAGFYRQKRGLIEVSGKEAVQFLNGLITNDVAKLQVGAQMSAAFPNVQGRLLAFVRVFRTGDKFLFETEDATRDKIFQNLFRFTFAGDFFVEDLSEKFDYAEIHNLKFEIENSEKIVFDSKFGKDFFIPKASADEFLNELKAQNAVEISDALYEVLRIENGVPIYGIDVNETNVVLESGLDEAVNFNKGCYIGQEIIARIHFRGHVAKQLTGLVFEDENINLNHGDEIKSLEDKNAGKITSAAFSPKLGKKVALGLVRYDFLAEETELKIGDFLAKVKDLPFIES
ncbi:MAG: glycine cleavage T C-terminal barrel domain-containing protein [Pyrinomonadaceae bacterium]